MSELLKLYKERFHFSVNFYSIFLLITFLPDFVGINAMGLRLAFWGVKVLLAFWIIASNRKILFNFSRWENLILIIYLIYGVNIFINVFINPLPITKGNDGVIDFVGFAVIIILMLSFRFDSAFSSNFSFLFFAVTLTLGLVIAYFHAIPNYTLDFNHVRYDANSTVNSIGYGQSGCALSLISIFGIINYKKGWMRILFAIAFIIGMLSIAKAGSRSPVVVLIVVMTFYFMARLGSINGIFIIGIIGLLMFLFIDQIVEIMSLVGSDLADRMVSMVQNKESSGRDEIWTNVIHIIQASPIFGKYYVVPTGTGSGLYPHNFFLEIFMGTGVIGGIPFIILIFYSLSKSYKLLHVKHPSTWIIILYLQMIFFGMFSTSLYSSQDFWTLVFYVVSIRQFKQIVSKNYRNTVSQRLAVG